ncbi:flagellin domain protein [Psychromonas ingrahamii 37]|uniref:Flagellin n=1 Tax=Psychromonas ingrahamii (strain DSM 17664 / CCUG 51855 / 37) TaxID=357804 RepID=A1T0K5_PSYIN|nr:flagellin [Psychromonas ingrahamii]ABM05270.1 flagellin domain protein [Psychromonas ingrahamii 37]
MALSIQTNYANLVGQNTLNKTNADFNTSLERLSTGFRINSASDDAAGLQISNRLEAQGRGMGVAMRNAGDATSQMQTAEGAMEEMTNIAYRMSDLATQSANGTASDDDRTAMEAEFQSLASELGSLMENTNMGGQKLLDKTDGVFAAGAISYQVGNTSAETLSVDITAELGEVVTAVGKLAGSAAYIKAYDADIATAASAGSPTAGEIAAAAALGLAAAEAAGADATVLAGFTDRATVETKQEAGGFTLSSQDTATKAIDTLSGFITDIGATRSQLGANINRLDHTMANLASMSENTAAAKSRIMDTDMAAESSAMSKNQMLMQAGAQVLSSTKMVPQLAMSLMG